MEPPKSLGLTAVTHKLLNEPITRLEECGLDGGTILKLNDVFDVKNIKDLGKLSDEMIKNTGKFNEDDPQKIGLAVKQFIAQNSRRNQA